MRFLVFLLPLTAGCIGNYTCGEFTFSVEPGTYTLGEWCGATFGTFALQNADAVQMVISPDGRDDAAVTASIDHNIERYFALCDHVLTVRGAIEADAMLDVRHEDFVADPDPQLRRVLAFLGLDAPDDFVADATSIVYASPHHSRHKLPWTDAQIATVRERIAGVDYLADYTWEA